jgi:E3 ubiquitin-protein ligase DOA10
VNSVLGAARKSGGTTYYLRLLFIAILVIPVGLIIASSWLNYDAAFRDAHNRVFHATDAIHEYALKVFETDELILDHIASRRRH